MVGPNTSEYSFACKVNGHSLYLLNFSMIFRVTKVERFMLLDFVAYETTTEKCYLIDLYGQ